MLVWIFFARRYTKTSAGERHKKNPTSFRDHAILYECLPLPHSPTPRPPIRHIARPPTLQLSWRFDSRATHARTRLHAALASVPFGFVLVRVWVRSRVPNLIAAAAVESKVSKYYLFSITLDVSPMGHGAFGINGNVLRFSSTKVYLNNFVGRRRGGLSIWVHS